MLQRNTLSMAEKFAFWAAVALAVTMALLPHPPHSYFDRFGDKAGHMLAFAVLAGLAAFAFPSLSRWRIAWRLSLLGALIEVGQSIPWLHRDCDVLDWAADMLAVLVMLGALWVLRLPRGAFARN